MTTGNNCHISVGWPRWTTSLTSDPAMKQFLLYLDETNALGKKFIIQDLDETHLFVLAEVVHILQEKVGDLMDQNSFPIMQK
ncbi:general transcription factor IIH subunit 5 isoform X1 [Cetorhinus maximus]|uniref:general transcription factor IIH subunit 5 isoform X1 n=1 Tax=Carcharodon carcharias TaxID=13397 RepID=UPI001B7DFA5E|nr:general transcription factor IIH subunit 5 isoform X1 [Carcharodon carcharias]XP_041038754.1 general transcription factor IIH subunit 5 isoform X1 [Carcharodon carcharias]XP_041038755.1 general transcription factor IIH subunit 5 isoform X1 [Carcharodon carcharias]